MRYVRVCRLRLEGAGQPFQDRLALKLFFTKIQLWLGLRSANFDFTNCILPRTKERLQRLWTPFPGNPRWQDPRNHPRKKIGHIYIKKYNVTGLQGSSRQNIQAHKILHLTGNTGQVKGNPTQCLVLFYSYVTLSHEVSLLWKVTGSFLQSS